MNRAFLETVFASFPRSILAEVCLNSAFLEKSSDFAQVRVDS